MKQLLKQSLSTKLVQRLTIPAPSRCTYTTPEGWTTRQWTEVDVFEALKGGAYFVKGRHQFATVKAAKAAGVKHD